MFRGETQYFLTAQVVRRREKAFSTLRIPPGLSLGDAMVGPSLDAAKQPHHRPLCAGSYAVIAYGQDIMVGRGEQSFTDHDICSLIILCNAKVLAVYSQAAGKGAAHAWQDKCQNIGSASYISVQVFEPWLRNRFRAVLGKVVHLRTFTFAHISSDELLTLLPAEQVLTGSLDPRTLELDHTAYTTFVHLRSSKDTLLATVAHLGKLRRKGTKGTANGGD